MPIWLPWLGGAAAFLTSISYLPQVSKAWPRGATKDLSWKTLLALTVGLLLWTLYGFYKEDHVMTVANTFGASLSGCVLALKLRDLFHK